MVGAGVIGLAVALLAVGAAPVSATHAAGLPVVEAATDWLPPSWEDVTGIPAPLDESAGETAPADADPPELEVPELVDWRIRNDGAHLHARYVHVPGGTAFNDRVDAIIDAAVAEAAGSGGLSPEVFPTGTGLGERGCAPGVSRLDAGELLADPRFGPGDDAGDSVGGVSVACEIVFAAGDVLGVHLRTVVGTGGDVREDTGETFFLDLATGALFTDADLWSDAAAAALWETAVSHLRRTGGSLSLAPLAAPDAEQLALAHAGLDRTVPTAAGAAVIRIAPGLAARFAEPEEAGADFAGVDLAAALAPTESATEEVIAPATAAAWVTPEGAQVLAAAGTPLRELEREIAGGANGPVVDCRVHACVAITYDDGPSELTEQLLDTLAETETPATFFMLGNAVSALPGIAQRAVEDGHEIGSHTMTHPDLTQIEPKDARAQVHDAAAVITRTTGQPVTIYRPPYGAMNDRAAEEIRMPAIYWSIDTLDWEQPGPEALVERAVEGAERGDIILFHDTHADTVHTADEIIRGLRDRGFTPVTVTELFGGAVPADGARRA